MAVDWNGPAAEDHVRSRVVRSLYRAAIVVERKAKELLSIAGTGTTTAPTRKERKAARAKFFARLEKKAAAYNQRHAKEIIAGERKAQRVTTRGRITTRRHKNRPT